MAFKKFRKMKVYEANGCSYKRTPSSILKGDWLKETGFDVGVGLKNGEDEVKYGTESVCPAV